MGDQVDLPAQEVPHDSSNDSCPTLPYSSNSPIPFPFTASTNGTSSLPIAINVSLNSNIITHNSTTYSSSTPILSSILTPRSFQTPSSILLTPISDSYNTCLHSPYFSNSFPQTGPSVFPGPSFFSPYPRPSFPITGSIPSPSLSSIVTPSTLPASFPSSRLQPDFEPCPSRRSFKVPKATLPRRRRASRGRRRLITSTASCQTSPFPNYFWPGFQPNRVFLGGPSTDGALDLALMPRAYDHFPTSLPPDPFHYDFFSVLKATSPIVTFHCPSPFTQKNFSFIYSIHFPHGKEAKPLLVTGIQRSVSLSLLFQPLLITLMFSQEKVFLFFFFF